MLRIVYSIFILFLLTAAPGSAKSPIIVGGETDYPPYSFLDENGDPTGFQIDLTRSIARVMGMDIEIRLSAWADARKGLDEGSVDIICGMFYSDKRAETYDFSPPYSIVGSVIFARKNSPPAESIEDLRGREIIVMRGEAMHDYAIQHQLTDKLLLAETPDGVLRRLSSGKGAYALGAQMPGLYWIKKLGLSNIIIVGEPLIPFKNCFAVRKGKTLLLSRFTEGLTILNQTGEYLELYEKWFGVLQPKGLSPAEALKYAVAIFAPLLLLLAGAFAWSWALKRTVARRTSELLESRRRIQTLSDNLPGGYVYQIVMDGEKRRFAYLSAGVEKLHGVSVKDALDDPALLYDRFFEEDRRVLAEQEFLMQANMSRFYVEIRYRAPSGETRWMLLTSSPRTLPDQSVAADGLAMDITERKQAYEKLRISSQRLTMAQRIAKLGDFTWDVETGEVVWSEGLYELLGYDKSEKIDYEKVNSEIHHPDDLDRVASWLNECVASGGGELTPNEYRLIRKDGRMIYVHTAGVIERINGNVRVFATLQDITERKRFEYALIDEKERLMVTLRSIGDGVITTGVEGRVVLINTVGEDLTGWTQDEAQGKHISEVFQIINEQTRLPVENPVEKVINTGKIAGIDRNTMLVSRSGVERIIADSGAPIRNHDGGVIGVVLVFRDVTQQSLMENEIRKSQKLESIGLLAGGIAHDFNNILGVILGNISYVLSQTNRNDGLWEVLDDVQTGAKQARKLTQQLLTFAGGGAPVKKDADIREVLKESAIFVTRGARARCEFEFAEDLWTAKIDPGQMNQATTNLVMNAAQATPEGGVIRIKAENSMVSSENSMLLPPGEYIRISIEDSGTGIDDRHITKIFDPYFTTKQQGRGLGLATTYSIISGHDGHISVESKKGEGTVFYIYLPADSRKPVVNREKSSAAHKGQGKILIMDDQEMILKMAARLLQRMGYETACAKDGAQAVEMYLDALNVQHPFDLVILDLTIPGGMGGSETMSELLKIDPNVKGVVSSGYSNDPVMAHYEAHGFCGIVPKPYTKSQLSEVLDKIFTANE